MPKMLGTNLRRRSDQIYVELNGIGAFKCPISMAKINLSGGEKRGKGHFYVKLCQIYVE